MPDNQASVWCQLDGGLVASFPAQIPRAQRAAGNTQVMDRLRLAQDTLNLLAHDGHLVVDIQIATGRITVAIAASARLAELVRQGRGVYYMRGVDQHGQHFRKGVLLGFTNVNVVWTERGN